LAIEGISKIPSYIEWKVVFLAKRETQKMTDEEKRQWDELYKYVKKEILLYGDNQSLPSKIVLMLKGLTKGKLIENRSTQDYASYTYEIILYTFKINKSAIMSGLSGKIFNSEISKFVYITTIVENNINDVYLRIENAKKSKEKTQLINIDNVQHEGAEYQKKTEEIKVSKKIEGLW
jgi:hypothetical protein